VLRYQEGSPSLCHHDAEQHAVTHHLVLVPEIKGSHRCTECSNVMLQHRCKIQGKKKQQNRIIPSTVNKIHDTRLIRSALANKVNDDLLPYTLQYEAQSDQSTPKSMVKDKKKTKRRDYVARTNKKLD
jgi:hypothetical protein